MIAGLWSAWSASISSHAISDELACSVISSRSVVNSFLALLLIAGMSHSVGIIVHINPVRLRLHKNTQADLAFSYPLYDSAWALGAIAVGSGITKVSLGVIGIDFHSCSGLCILLATNTMEDYS